MAPQDSKIAVEILQSVSRLPLDAMRGSLFDLTTGRISRYILWILVQNRLHTKDKKMQHKIHANQPTKHETSAAIIN